jgi:hypothetical protein
VRRWICIHRQHHTNNGFGNDEAIDRHVERKIASAIGRLNMRINKAVCVFYRWGRLRILSSSCVSPRHSAQRSVENDGSIVRDDKYMKRILHPSIKYLRVIRSLDTEGTNNIIKQKRRLTTTPQWSSRRST